MKDFSEFEKETKIVFKNKDLLKQAFIHRSYINENSGLNLTHNERLEFLGDAVLELITTDYLFRKYTNHNEGELTAFRSALVNTITIGGVAGDLGMGDFLLLSKGEVKDMSKDKTHILANTYEAFIGAVYLDQGYEVARQFVADTLFDKLKEIIKQKLWRDAKSLVQEKSQEYLNVTPSYKVIHESGPDHDKIFTIGIFFNDELITEGKGHSKQEAEQAAARKALEINHWSD